MRKPRGATDLPAAEGTARLPRDLAVWNGIEAAVAAQGHSLRHVLELWPAYVRRIHMARFIVHYELFKLIVDLPGCVVEMGVYRAPSLLTWSKLLEIFCPGDRTRRVYGFDGFAGLPALRPEDGAERPRVGKNMGGWSAGDVKEEVEELVRVANLDNMISGSERCNLVIGDVNRASLAAWLEAHPGVRISLLHLDLDLYEPTLVALRALYPKVVTGGVVIFDEYGMEPWEGESRAVEEYFGHLGQRPIIKKFPFQASPHGYMIKP